MRMTASDVAAHQARVKGSRPGLPAPPAPLQPRRQSNKYRAVKKEVDGIVFDSTFEARHYERLALFQRAGIIQALRIHHPWPLVVNGEEVACWESDFDYLQDGKPVVVDVKGYADPLYRLKFKLFNVLYKPVSITEIRQTKRYKAG